jgi:hypothetical protein
LDSTFRVQLRRVGGGGQVLPQRAIAQGQDAIRTRGNLWIVRHHEDRQAEFIPQLQQ